MTHVRTGPSAPSASGWPTPASPRRASTRASPWYQWGPYLSERAWGTVREDYSADGDAWAYFPHDHARSRAYRWNEDGMAGISDVFGRLCLGLALWNGRDPILKERMFGLTNSEGNHGEDVKEYWWYLDALPSSAWLRWRYHYPQAAFPYDDLVAENARRSKLEPEYELLDTGVFDDDRYWIVEVHYAKADPTDILMRITRPERGPEAATLHVLPTLWFRNTWSWEPTAGRVRRSARRPAAGSVASHPELGDYELFVGAGPDGDRARAAVLRERDERRAALRRGRRPRLAEGRHQRPRRARARRRVNPGRTGTKAAAWYRLTVRARRDGRDPAPAPAAPGTGARPARPAAATARGRIRRRSWPVARPRPTSSTPTCAGRTPPTTRRWSCARPSRACSGASSSTPTTSGAGSTATRQPDRPPSSALTGRNAGWRHFDAADILSMPDKWEYPWFAAWDLAFHAVTLAHVDPAFAKYQLLVLCREWFQHPNGALPAYEWSFDDVNPPVHALAALAVWEIDGRPRHAVPRADLPQAAAQLHLVAEPPGRGGQRPLRRRVPRARQPERVRPLEPAGRRAPRAVRRDRLDVRLLHVDAADGARRWRARPGLRRPDDDVPRARRPDRRAR